MRYLIDGYNLLFRLSLEESTLEKARERVNEISHAIAKLRKLSVIVIYDGKREKGLGFSRKYYRDIEIIYTADGVSADDFILDMLSREKHPALYTVVTSDKRLHVEAKRYRAHALLVEAFLEEKATSKGTIEEKILEDTPQHKERLRKAFEKRIEKGEK